MTGRRTTVRWWTAVLAVVTAAGAAGGLQAQEGEEEKAEDAHEEVRERRVVVTPGPPAAPRLPGWTGAWMGARQGGYLGVAIRDVDGETAEELRLPEVRGARVTDVREDSPAAEAGLREDDVVVRYNGEPVESVAALRRLVRETPPGREARLGVIRDGARREVTVQVGERPGLRMDPERMRKIHERMERAMELRGEARKRLEELRERLEDLEIEGPDLRELHVRMKDFGPGELDVEGLDEFRLRGGDGAFLFLARQGRAGLRLQPLTDQLAEYFGVEDGDGALVASVRDGSPAAEAGLRAGDVIVRVDGREAEGPGDVIRALRRADEGSVVIAVVRRGEERTFTVELPGR